MLTKGRVALVLNSSQSLFFSPHEAGLVWSGLDESVFGVWMKRPKQKMNSPIVNCVLLPYKNAIIVPCQKSSF